MQAAKAAEEKKAEETRLRKEKEAEEAKRRKDKTPVKLKLDAAQKSKDKVSKK